ncbi:MAG TPA: hypothetical protein VM182_01390 [Terriglobia bacterium]|nr:hypothetical protein [Terriglobia bacterium]
MSYDEHDTDDVVDADFKVRDAAVFSDLTASEQPVATFPELANILERFILHLRRGRKHLLRYGYPGTRFPGSFRLHTHLG